MFLEARCKLFIIVCLLYASTASSPVTVAQDPIRVETNQVVVPVVVIDKTRFRREGQDHRIDQALLHGDGRLVDAIASGLLVLDLTAADFQVLDDGKEQPIQNVTIEPSLYWDVRDNEGHHTEYIGPGGGKWSTTEWPPGHFGDVDAPQHYLVAYTVPESLEGSCHRIKIKVKRRNVLVRARSEYCNSKHSPSDAARGTKLGEQLDRALTSPQKSDFNISLKTTVLFTNSDVARVHIALDWPWKSLKADSTTKGVLGMVFNKDGTAAQFSDLADREGVSDRVKSDQNSNVNGQMEAENRYETQLSLPPGEYDLRVVLGDGEKFGRTASLLRIDALDLKEVAISTVSLCKQIDDVSAYSSGHASTLPGAWDDRFRGEYVPLVSKDIEFKPTGNTRFKKGETLYTYFEVYEPLLAGQSPATVQFQLRIVDAKTTEKKSDSEPIDATPYVKAGNRVIPIGRGIDISKLSTGSYRLEVQATDSAGKSTPWGMANFTVE
jgi:hypothetical protein